MKHRTKQVEVMIEQANQYIRLNHIKDEGNEVFQFVTHFLLTNKLYRGFNYFKYKEYTGVTGNTAVFIVHAGTSDPEQFDFLQIL